MILCWQYAHAQMNSYHRCNLESHIGILIMFLYILQVSIIPRLMRTDNQNDYLNVSLSLTIITSRAKEGNKNISSHMRQKEDFTSNSFAKPNFQKSKCQNHISSWLLWHSFSKFHDGTLYSSWVVGGSSLNFLAELVF